MLRLAAQYCQRVPCLLVAGCDEFQAGMNRSYWVSQLMAQGRQEVFLIAVLLRQVCEESLAVYYK
jgi:hypothetical protein